MAMHSVSILWISAEIEQAEKTISGKMNKDI